MERSSSNAQIKAVLLLRHIMLLFLTGIAALTTAIATKNLLFVFIALGIWLIGCLVNIYFYIVLPKRSVVAWVSHVVMIGVFLCISYALYQIAQALVEIVR